MKPGLLSLQDHITGNTFHGLNFKLRIFETSDYVDLSSSTAKTDFRKDNEVGEKLKSVSTGDGMSLIDSETLRIDPFLLSDFPTGKIVFSIKIEDAGEVQTYVKGFFYVQTEITNN